MADVPNIGTGAGGFWGALGSITPDTSLPTQYGDRNQIMQTINAGLGQQAPTMGGYFQGAQMGQIGQLQQIASGQRQGAGELAAQRQTQNALAGQQALARMARGNNSALAMRQGARNAAGIGLSGAGQAQQAALMDQQSAQQALMQALQGARGQDIQAQLGQGQLGLGYLGQLTGMDQSQLAASVAAKQSQNQLLGGLLNQGGQLAGLAMM